MVEAKKATATLGGIPLLLVGDGVEWIQREGVLPNIQSFFMAPDDAKALEGITYPLDLIITPIEGNALKVTNLWVLNICPGPNPFISEVVVADRRWFWSYGIVVGHYNVRRAVGVKRVINTQELDVNFDRAKDIAYWRWSLQRETKPFSPYEMMGDVLQKVARIEKDYWGRTFDILIDERIGEKIKNIPIEDLSISGIPGDQALNIARGFLPNAGIRVDHDGRVTVYARASLDEEKIAEALVPEIWGGGHTDIVRNSLLRPKEVHVLFTRKVEVRMDFIEQSSARLTQTSDPEPLGDMRRMDNVVIVPDYEITINNRRLPQGSFVTIDDYMNALPNLPIEGVTARMDHEYLQRAGVPQMDLWAVLGITGNQITRGASLEPWPARLATLQRHYRMTFRINRRWVDRFMHWSCERIATVDPQTGQRGPSQAYGDYCIIPSQRAKFRNHARGEDFTYAINCTSFPQSGILDQTARPSPGIVTQLDHDQGILRVDYAMDLSRTYEMVIPGNMLTETIPTADFTSRARTIAFNAIKKNLRSPRMAPTFRLCVIFTAVPASPNGAQQLHRIVVKASDVSDAFPANARQSRALGPVMEIRVGAGREVARIRWEDDRSETIEKIFGIREVKDDEESQKAFAKEVSDLCMNEGSSGGEFGASLNAIARAEAAAVYAALADRYEGSMTGHMNGGVQIAGWAGELRHSLKPTGETTTALTLPKDVPQFNMLAFLSSSERAILMRLAKP